MAVEKELIEQIMGLNYKGDKIVDRIEIRYEDDYWFVDVIWKEGLDGHEAGTQYYGTTLEGAIAGALRDTKERTHVV